MKILKSFVVCVVVGISSFAHAERTVDEQCHIVGELAYGIMDARQAGVSKHELMEMSQDGLIKRMLGIEQDNEKFDVIVQKVIDSSFRDLPMAPNRQKKEASIVFAEFWVSNCYDSM